MACEGTPSAQGDTMRSPYEELEEVPKDDRRWFDVPRAQITFDYLDTGTGR